MSVFMVALVVGLAGLVLMALPAMRRGHGGRAHGGRGRGRGGHAGRGHAGRGAAAARGHGAAAGGHAGRGALARGGAHGHAAHNHGAPHGQHNASVAGSLLGYFPEPRLVFTVLALFGAFGNLLERAPGVPGWGAVIGALAIAVVLEWLVVGRLWRFVFGFGGEASSPLEGLVMDHAEAVTPFRNGRGIVRVVRDGRAVQLTGELAPDARNAQVGVGDRLTIEEVDTERERVVVSLV